MLTSMGNAVISEILMVIVVGICSIFACIRALFGPEVSTELLHYLTSKRVQHQTSTTTTTSNNNNSSISTQLENLIKSEHSEANGDCKMEGFLFKKGQKIKNWKKRYFVLCQMGKLKYYSNVQDARQGIGAKGSLTVYTAAAMSFADRPYGIKIVGTLGRNFYVRAEDRSTHQQWLLALTRRAIQGAITGRLDSALQQTGDGMNLTRHILKVGVQDFGLFAKDSKALSLGRQYYAVVKFKSELHDLRLDFSVGQTGSQKLNQLRLIWNEDFSWEFADHECKNCKDCLSFGLRSGIFHGLPDTVVIQLYEVSLLWITKKVGTTQINLSEIFFSGCRQSTLKCSLPLLSSDRSSNCNSDQADGISGNIGEMNIALSYESKSSEEHEWIPFLASNESERELLLSPAIELDDCLDGNDDRKVVINDVDHFFSLFFDDGVTKVWDSYYKERKDEIGETGKWEPSNDHGGRVRVITCRSLTGSSIGPASTMTTRTQHVMFYPDDDSLVQSKEETSEINSSKSGKKKKESSNKSDEDEQKHESLIISEKVFLHDIPYGDCFTVETVTVVKNVMTANSVKVSVEVFLAVPFSKGCMWKSKIIDSTKKGLLDSTKLLYSLFARAATIGRKRQHSHDSNSSSQISDLGSVSSNKKNRRALLARAHSVLDGTAALEEIFENQRGIFGHWGPNHLLPTDRPRFSNRAGDLALDFDQIKPPVNWSWTSDWAIDYNYTECDEEGWSYAADFPRFNVHLSKNKSSSKKMGASVRRRRWIRTLCHVPTDISH